MAKKTFKKGLGSLIQDTRHKDEAEESKDIIQPADNKQTDTDKGTDKHIKELEYRLIQQERELRQWRTGTLTTDKFRKTLDKFNLIYDVKSNELKRKGE